MNNSKPYFNILLQLARIDGDISTDELELIREIARSHNFSDEEFDQALKAGETKPSLESLSGLSENERVDMICNLIRLMKADGRVDRSEMEFCFSIVEKLGLKGHEFIRIVLDTIRQDDLFLEVKLWDMVESAMIEHPVVHVRAS